MRFVVGAAACVVATVLLAGCSSVVNGTPTAPPSSSSGASPVTASTGLGGRLQSIAVQARDLAVGYTARLVTDGNRVKGQVSLDNCGFNFTTEKDRVARRQYGVFNSASAYTGLNNEVIAYDTPAHAAKALRQWHRAAATCPHGVIHSRTPEDPKSMRIRVSRNMLDQSGLPLPANAVTIETVRARVMHKQHFIAIIQVRGRYLDAVYGTSPHPFTAAELGTVERLATITGLRLAAVH